MPKSIAYRLLEPALAGPAVVRLICHEGRFDDLLAQLAVHRLDLVIADEPLGRQHSVKAFNHPLGTTAMSFFATPRAEADRWRAASRNASTARRCCCRARRRRCASASSCGWPQQRLRPRIVGEFDDAALMKAFGADGRGVFMTPTVLEAETCAQYGVRVLGRTAELVEEFHAISVERRITHPCVVAMTQAARGGFLER